MPRIYLDPKRAFGGVLNDAEERLSYYRSVIATAEAQARQAESHARCTPAPYCGSQTAFPKGTCR